MIHETQQSINKWQKEHFPDATEDGILRHLSEEFSEFNETACYNNTQATAEEAADVVILLYSWAGKVGIDLQKEIDKKMLINRHRKWNIQSDGTGRHVKEK